MCILLRPQRALSTLTAAHMIHRPHANAPRPAPASPLNVLCTTRVASAPRLAVSCIGALPAQKRGPPTHCSLAAAQANAMHAGTASSTSLPALHTIPRCCPPRCARAHAARFAAASETARICYSAANLTPQALRSSCCASRQSAQCSFMSTRYCFRPQQQHQLPTAGKWCPCAAAAQKQHHRTLR